MSGYNDMSAKPCDNYKMIMINYTDLWIVHSQVARLLDGARLELRELKDCSLLLGVCTSCPLLSSDLEASAVEIKDFKHKLNHSSCYSVLSPSCELCGSLKGKCHTRFLCQNQVLIICMAHDQLLHTYGQKCSQKSNCHE
jgi:hypothetical protein